MESCPLDVLKCLGDKGRVPSETYSDLWPSVKACDKKKKKLFHAYQWNYKLSSQKILGGKMVKSLESCDVILWFNIDHIMKEELIYTSVSLFMSTCTSTCPEVLYITKNANKRLNDILREHFHLSLKRHIFSHSHRLFLIKLRSSFKQYLNNVNSNAYQWKVRD